jgi:hypothetical protein
LLFLLLGGALALVAPGGMIYFLIPPAVVLIGIAASRWYPPAATIGGIAGVVLLFLTWGELLVALEELFSPGPLWVVAPAAAMMIAAALIEAQALFAGARRRLVLTASGLIALLAWIVAGTAPAYSQDHQQRFTIEHVTEFPSGRSSWSVLNDGRRMPQWYERTTQWRGGKLSFSDRMRALAPATPLPGIQPPSVQPLEVVRNGSERTLRLRLKSNGAERVLLVAPPESRIRTAGVTGFVRPIADEGSSGKFTISCTGRHCDGMELLIVLSNPKPVTFTIVGARNGLPATAAPLVRARPRFARPQYTPDETLAVTRVTL